MEMWNGEINRIAGSGDMSRLTADRLADYQSRLRHAERQLNENAERKSALPATSIDPDLLTAALYDFDSAWNAMPSRHQRRVLQLLVQQIDYDGSTGKIGITFHPHGFEGFATTMTQVGQLNDKSASDRIHEPL